MTTFTAAEIKTIDTVFYELDRMSNSDLNKVFGSITIKEIRALAGKLRYAGYCERHGIRYEDMTELDFEDAALEEAERDGYAV